MVEIEGSTTCIYTSIRLLNVLGNRGVCRDTTRGCRALVVLHAVVGVNDSACQYERQLLFCQAHDRYMFTGACPVNRQTRENGVGVKAEDEISVAFFDLFEKLENPLP
jgi:hypothetical protein